MKKPTKILVLSIVCDILAILCIIFVAIFESDYEKIDIIITLAITALVLVLGGCSFMILWGMKMSKYKKMEEARKWEALSDEEKEAIEAQRKKEEQEKENARTIIKTKLIGQDSTKDASSSVARGVVGGVLFGVAGAMAGAMSGENKRNFTFYITYKDGHTETKTVEADSTEFKIYMAYLKD